MLPREEKSCRTEAKSGAGTGLYYYGARYYDPSISVWLSVDPLAEETMTPYQYAYQNPVRYADPTGMAGDDVIEITKGTGDIKVTKAAGDDVVKLRNEYTGEVEKQYTYGENGSFRKDNLVTQGKDGTGNRTTIIETTNTNKLFRLFKFASYSSVEFGYLRASSNTGDKIGILVTSHKSDGVNTLPSKYFKILSNKDWKIDEMWHSHPEPVFSNTFNNYPSGFLHDGTISDWDFGDRPAFERMQKSFPNRVPESANIYSPFTNQRIIYNHKTFRTIENYK